MATLKSQLDSILNYIDISAIADEYMDKMPAWFYEHAKDDTFIQEDKEQLRSALLDLSDKIKRQHKRYNSLGWDYL